jgi:tetratricopeptide (TPR) repeat protein
MRRSFRATIMLKRRHFVLGLLVLLSVCACKCSAQRVSSGVDSSQVGNIRVHVENSDNRAAGHHLRVRLMNGASSTQVSENFTDEQGVSQFAGVPIGEYHILVSGDGIQEADSGQFEVDRRKLSQSIYITVRPSEETKGQAEQGLPSVSKAELLIPANARKESDRATKAMGEQDWGTAVQHLKRAIELYADYAMAYNNLGVVYGHLNDSAHEKEALQKAIEIDSHFASPNVNLAKLCLREQDTSQAQTLLENANRAEPNNPETMTLLAQAQLLNKHFDAAIGTAHDVHAIPHANFAVVHYIAARAMEREGHSQEALAELQVFLTEESTGARADQVRKEIAQLQGHLK